MHGNSNIKKDAWKLKDNYYISASVYIVLIEWLYVTQMLIRVTGPVWPRGFQEV